MGNSHIFDEQIDRLLGEVGVTEFYSVLDEAVAFAREICAASNEEFNLGDWERWEMSQDHQKLTLFSDSSANRLSFDIQIVGTFSHESGSWKWSWDNPNIDDQLTSDAKTVKVYGLEHGFDPVRRSVARLSR
jgi:hypothetical protein